MRRNAYRTQPLLVRSPDPMPRWARITLLWSGVAVGLVVVSRAITVAAIDPPGPPPEVPVAAAPLAAPPGPGAAPALPVLAAAEPAPGLQAPAHTQLAAAPAPPSLTAPERPVSPPAAKPRRFAAAPARLTRSAADAQGHYRRAVADYAANERSAGYRWARQNDVMVRRYCSDIARQRNADFMRGCMAYLTEVRR